MNFKPIEEAIYKAGKIVANANNVRIVATKSEGRQNFVTEIDLQVEKILKDAIQKHFPTHTILSEETESNLKDLLSLKHLWVMDPIDGTVNFRFGRAYSGISVGYVEKGEVRVGMIFNPFRNEFFHAKKGEGAFVNDRKIFVGSQSDFSEAMVYTECPYEAEATRLNLKTLLKLRPTPMIMIRGSIVLGLGDVASGRADLYFTRNAKPWDNAAGFLIAEEAGAVMTNFKGEKIDFTSGDIVVGNPTLVEKFVRAIA